MKGESKVTISFVDEKAVPASSGDTILGAAIREGIPHFHSCGGKAKCSTCRVIIHRGVENIAGVTPEEEILAKKLSFPPRVRLACQARIVTGEVVVERIIKPNTTFSKYTGLSKKLEKLILDRNAFGSEKALVLFFLDIRNFTPFVASNLAFDVVHVTRRVFDVIYRIINDTGGKIIETAGDQVFAVFGLTSSPHQAVDAALKSAEMLIDAIDVLNRTYLEVYFATKLNFGIGIHYGNVVVGDVNLGIEDHMSVVGLAVIEAARVQERTRKLNNCLLVTEAVMKITNNHHGYPSVYVRLKGLRRRYKVYKVGRAFD